MAVFLPCLIQGLSVVYMAEFTRLPLGGLDCEGEEGEHGERGERGHRGKRGHRGPSGHDGRDGATGPTGPTGATAPFTGGLLKFSGLAPAPDPGGAQTSYLADSGIELVAALTAPNYPVPIDRVLVNFSVNVRTELPAQEVVEVSLLLNGTTVLATATYVGGGSPSSGIQNIPFGPTPVGINDVLDVRVLVLPGAIAAPVPISAMVGTQ